MYQLAAKVFSEGLKLCKSVVPILFTRINNKSALKELLRS